MQHKVIKQLSSKIKQQLQFLLSLKSQVSLSTESVNSIVVMLIDTDKDECG